MKDLHRVFLVTVLLALLSASCSRERPEGSGDGEHSLRITPRIDSFITPPESSAATSRAIVDGTAFANGNEVGYIVLGSAGSYRNAGLPHLDGYGNVRAQMTGTNGAWLYYIYNTQYVGLSLPGFPSYGKVDIYGYHPYNADIDENDLHAIPYSLGTVSETGVATTAEMVEKDYMYAEPALNHVMRSGQSAHMTFRHIMTCLEFRVRKIFAGPALTLSTIDFTITGTNGRVFTVSGTFDAADGTVTRGPSAARILVNYNRTLANTAVSSSAALSCSLMLPSLECSGVGDDATVSAVFHFTDQDGDEWRFHDGADAIYTFKLSDVTDASGNKGLRAGKRYQVTVEVSNFVKYSGMPAVVYPDWDADKEDADPNVI